MQKNINSTHAYPTNPDWIRIKTKIRVGGCIWASCNVCLKESALSYVKNVVSLVIQNTHALDSIFCPTILTLESTLASPGDALFLARK